MSDNTTLGNVLQTHHRFHIPNYQRDYAWGAISLTISGKI